MGIVQETIERIEQSHCEALSRPWTCRECVKEQPPPPPEGREPICGPCLEAKRQERIACRVTHLPELIRKRVGIPPRFVRTDLPLPGFLTPCLASDHGVCLTGPAGVGKTMAVCLLALARYRRWAESGEEPQPSWRFLSFPAFVMELQDAWRREDAEQSALSLLKSAVAVEHLILDDLGAEKLTDYVRQAVYYLVNEREQWQRPTYLTTNFSLEQLDGQFDSRISSRIAGMCEVIALKGQDRRLKGWRRDDR